MTRIERALASIAADLAELRASWALVGGLALAVHAEPRMTRDVDVDVAVAVEEDSEAQALVRQLVDLGYRLLRQHEHEPTGRLAHVRLLPPGGDVEGAVLDLLFASSGIEDQIVASAETVEVFPGTSVPLISAGHLLALKVLADRDQDRADARSLLDTMSAREVERARNAIRDVQERGFHRGRDVVAALEALVATDAGD